MVVGPAQGTPLIPIRGSAGGLLLNSLLGWSWADPFVAVVVAAVAVKEGHEAWRGHGRRCRPGVVAQPMQHVRRELPAGSGAAAVHGTGLRLSSG